MKPHESRRRNAIRRVHAAKLRTRDAERAVIDLDALFLEPHHRLPFDPGVPHAVTVEIEPVTERARVRCTCGGDTGWLLRWDAELRAHWHRRQAGL